MIERLRESLEIYNEAMETYKPYAVVAMVSGGDDSLLLMQVIKELDIHIDMIIHGVTGTGIAETRQFVHELAENSKIRIEEANAGDAYENYVMRKGFFGKGVSAHTLSYHVLKATPFGKTTTKHIRQGVRGRNILFLNGVRVDESENRADKLGEKYFNASLDYPKNIWVNLIHWWLTTERDEYLSGNSVKRNPVAIALGRSGECMCGTMQTIATGMQASILFPEWGKWWMALRKKVIQKFPWDWGQNINSYHHQEMKGQGNMFKEEPFMPMCVGCKSKIKIDENAQF